MTTTELRKRPRQQRSGQTVQAVLEAAAQVLEAGGLPAFNTNAVAQRAGVSIGSVYQYFPGKDAVMAALVRREAERFEQALAAGLIRAADLPLDGAVAVLVQVAVAHQTARPNLARILDLEERRLGVEGEAAAADRTTADRLAAFLAAHGIPRAQVAALDLRNLTRGMVDGAPAAEPLDLARRITRAAMGYLAA